ncbi:MAG TPA: ferritin-like domain-containing protein [Gemmataceae bacterium]|jgi:bacterioferritin|nr:ferritin-like domain-containing protein [Gemmataceae bacterium]
MAASKEPIIAALQTAYNMELETVTNYLANSIHLDGVRAEAIKKALTTDITGELGHATQIGHRLKQLGSTVPGSLHLKMTQKSLQPPAETTDVVAVIRGVVAAEEEAISHYQSIIKMCEGIDYVTQDLAIKLLADEEAHRQEFEGYLKEYIKQ